MLIVAEIGGCRALPQRPTPVRLGRTDPHRAQLGRPGTARPHLRPRLKTLRWALVEAAQKACQGGGPLRQDFERIAKRRGRKIAKVAIARKLLTLCYYGLRDGEIRCLKPPGRASAMKVMAPSQ
jgi:hypothetical protein